MENMTPHQLPPDLKREVEEELHGRYKGWCAKNNVSRFDPDTWLTFEGGWNAALEWQSKQTNERIEKLEKALEIARRGLHTIIRLDQHESIYPRGPGVSQDTLSAIDEAIK